MVAIQQFNDLEELSKGVGEYIIDLQNRVLGTAGSDRQFNVAISGGSLINVLAKCLVENPATAPKVEWSRWNIYFCDERLVPLEHSDSNYGSFKKHILNPLTNSGNHLGPTVYTINESLLKEDSNDRIADEYEKLLLQGKHDEEKNILLDLVLLGCGPDGHTCSLFPGDAHRDLITNSSKKLVLWCKNSPKPPSDRVTFTLDVLERTSSVVFVADGSAKRKIIKKIFDVEDEEAQQDLPCALVNSRCNKNVSWFVTRSVLEEP